MESNRRKYVNSRKRCSVQNKLCYYNCKQLVKKDLRNDPKLFHDFVNVTIYPPPINFNNLEPVDERQIPNLFEKSRILLPYSSSVLNHQISSFCRIANLSFG